MGLIREPEGIDFVVEPHEVTEKDHLAMLAFIAACKDSKVKQKCEINKMKSSFRKIVTQGCDYVFANDYKLMSLSDLSKFIETNKHLPDVAPAAEMEAEGINLSEMNVLLLKK